MNNTEGVLRKSVYYALLVVVAAFFIIPFLWVVSTSLKGESQIFTIPPQWIPDTLHWENYSKVFNRMPFLTYLKNSVFISAVSIIGVVFSSSIVAYAFSNLNWPGRDKLFIFILATMMLPMQVTMIPLFVLFKNLHWLNTFKPLTVPAFFGGGAFNIFLLRQFFLTIPKDLLDSARMDGCSEFKIYWKIVFAIGKACFGNRCNFNFYVYVE